jgi:hypothetical protein
MTNTSDQTSTVLPDAWPPAVRDAFWTAVNAPSYEDSAAATLAFAQLLIAASPAVVEPPADQAAPELTAEEARALADDLGLQLYRAQDALAFVAECCDIADREGRQVTTANVREWLKGARCGRQLAADAADQTAILDLDAIAARAADAQQYGVEDDGFEQLVREDVPALIAALRRMAGETATETPAPGTCGHRSSEGHVCGQPTGHHGYHRNLRLNGDEWTSWVGERPATEAQQDAPWPVKETTRSYAAELRANPGTVAADGHTGWQCDAGAQWLIAASTPGPGKLGTHHGTIYACPAHQTAAVERITGAGFEADPQPAPPGHRWNPWPCGHVTAHGAAALTALTAAGARQDGAES